jgi:hypothetical protein
MKYLLESDDYSDIMLEPETLSVEFKATGAVHVLLTKEEFLHRFGNAPFTKPRRHMTRWVGRVEYAAVDLSVPE